MRTNAVRRNTVTDPGALSGLLALVAAVLVATQPVAAADDPPQRERAGHERIAERLVDLGRAPEAARQAAVRLTADDLRVLLAHPDMMQAAGGLEMTLGVVLVVGVMVGLAVAGATVIVISV